MLQQKIHSAHKNIQPETLSCRFCGSKEMHFLDVVNDYDFYECDNCLFTFCPAVDQKYMNNLYGSGYHNSKDGAPAAGWANIDFLQPALKLFENRKIKILDFGCGESHIPDRLRKLGHKVTGVDVAPPVREQEDRLTGDIRDLHLPENEFNLVYSYQVFEHLPQPLPVMKELFRITRPDGCLLIHTDMEVSGRFENGFDNWSYVSPPDHCAFFRNKTFDIYLKDKPHILVHKDEKTIIMRKKRHAF